MVTHSSSRFLKSVSFSFTHPRGEWLLYAYGIYRDPVDWRVNKNRVYCSVKKDNHSLDKSLERFKVIWLYRILTAWRIDEVSSFYSDSLFNKGGICLSRVMMVSINFPLVYRHIIRIISKIHITPQVLPNFRLNISPMFVLRLTNYDGDNNFKPLVFRNFLLK